MCEYQDAILEFCQNCTDEKWFSENIIHFEVAICDALKTKLDSCITDILNFFPEYRELLISTAQINILQAFLEYAKSIEDWVMYRLLLEDLGDASLKAEGYAEAEANYKLALEYAIDLNEKLGMVILCKKILYLKPYRQQNPVNNYYIDLILEKITFCPPKLQAEIYQIIATAYCYTGNIIEGEKFGRQALTKWAIVAQAKERLERMGQVAFSMATGYRMSECRSEAMDWLKKAYRFFSETDNTFQRVRVIYEYGMIFLYLDNKAIKALKCFQTGLNIIKNMSVGTPPKGYFAVFYQMMSLTLLELHSWESAKYYAEWSYRLRQDEENELEIAFTIHLLARAEVGLQNYEKARKLWNVALMNLNKLKHTNRKKVLQEDIYRGLEGLDSPI